MGQIVDSSRIIAEAFSGQVVALLCFIITKDQASQAEEINKNSKSAKDVLKSKVFPNLLQNLIYLHNFISTNFLLRHIFNFMKALVQIGNFMKDKLRKCINTLSRIDVLCLFNMLMTIYLVKTMTCDLTAQNLQYVFYLMLFYSTMAHLYNTMGLHHLDI
ncbi:MAG: hypothetical protein MHMPM18_003262 [Marteilia pararefringens]